MAFVCARVNKAFSLTSLSGMRGSELLYQYVIVFTSCFVRECNDFQLFFFFSNAGPSSLDSDMQIEI